MVNFGGLSQITRKSTLVIVVITSGILLLDLSTRLWQGSTRYIPNPAFAGRNMPVVRDTSNKTTAPATTTTTTTRITTTTTAIPGLISMDRDLKLPPEVPKRPESKEVILNYSQKRDYEPIIAHNDMCGGPGEPLSLGLEQFDYSQGIFLLVVVKSSCALSARRNAIRRTWGNATWAREELKVNVRLVFLLGACTSAALSDEVKEEDRKHGDMLQWDFFDSFRNLTLKDCLFMQWYTAHCRQVPFVFKGDDDVLVNLRNVVTYLKETEPASRENLFVGSLLVGSPRILDPRWKYYVSYNLYPEKLYPPYVSGGGFVMSGRMVVKLFRASLRSRIIPIDDAFLGILLQKIGVKPKNDRGFKSWGFRNVNACRLAKIKTYHKVSPDQLVDLWRELMAVDIAKCGKETDDVLRRRRRSLLRI